MKKEKIKQQRKERRAHRTRSRIKGTAEIPRLSVFRSLKHIQAQLIDDVQGVTLASASDMELKKGSKKEKAGEVGKKLAEQAMKKNIKQAVFDRGSYLYHGRVKELAEGAREGGLKF